MSGGTGNFLCEKAETFALRIVKLYQYLFVYGVRPHGKAVWRAN